MKQWEGIRQLYPALVRAALGMNYMAWEAITVDLMPLVDRMLGSSIQHAEALSSHPYMGHRMGLTCAEWIPVMVPFPNVRKSQETRCVRQSLDFEAWYAGRVDRLGAFEHEQDMMVLGLEVLYPKGVKRWHRNPTHVLEDETYWSAAGMLVCTPRNLGGEDVFAAVQKRLKPLLDLRLTLSWLLEFTNLHVTHLKTPGQVKTCWPEIARVISAPYSHELEQQRASTPPSVLKAMYARAVGEQVATVGGIEAAKAEVINLILDSKLLGHDGGVRSIEAHPEKAVIRDSAWGWINRHCYNTFNQPAH